MGSNTDGWTDEDVTLLRKQWLSPKSAKAIGLGFEPPRTKSAVIGKANRLKLGTKPKRKSDTGQKKVPGYGIQVRAKPKPKEKKPAKAPKVEVILVPQAPLEPPPLPADLVPTEALRHRMCRWPYGDPAKPGFGHCGCHTDQGVYCVGHARVAYRKIDLRNPAPKPIRVNYGKKPQQRRA